MTATRASRQWSLVVRVLAQRARADHEHGVEPAQDVTQAGAARRCEPGEQRMVLREPGRGAERLLEHRRAQPLGQRDQRRPVRARSRDDRRPLPEERRQRVHRLGRSRRGPHQPLRAEDLVRLRRGRGPVVHRHDHERRPAAALRRVEGADDRARHVLRAHRLLLEHRVLPREPVQPAGEERLLREVAAVLLAHDHHERHAVQARGGDRRDGVPQPGRAVQERQRGSSPAQRVPAGDAHHRPLVQRQHEAQVVRQPGQERHLGAARVGEDRRQLQPAEHVVGGVADGRHSCRNIARDVQLRL